MLSKRALVESKKDTKSFETGHVFCSFLAILLRRELERRLELKDYDFGWNNILHDINSVEEVTDDISGK